MKSGYLEGIIILWSGVQIPPPLPFSARPSHCREGIETVALRLAGPLDETVVVCRPRCCHVDCVQCGFRHGDNFGEAIADGRQLRPRFGEAG